MKYNCEITINKNINEVIKIWSDDNLLIKWQTGFKSKELLSGEKNQVGAKSKIIIVQAKNNIELVETIITNNLPCERKALYEHIHMSNTLITRFEKIDENHTRYITEVDYLKFNKLLIKIVAKLFPNMFRKQSYTWMENLKKLIENS